MPEATLLQILDAREKRVEKQKALQSAYKTPLICFTMNIAGPEKTSRLIERAFFEGLALLEENFSNYTVYCDKSIDVTGCEAMLCVSMEAERIKDVCTELENAHPLGRLFDMDVLDINGEKLSRKKLRGCIVCGKEGRECAAGRLHSVEELKSVTTKIIVDYFVEQDAKKYGEAAYDSLLGEVYTTPKAGLVDRNNNGSHNDMNIALFEKSASALTPYFCACFKKGYETKELAPAEAFSQLRSLGVEAEETMLKATGGINTHKGAIFSLGIVCIALGRLWSVESSNINKDEVFPLCAELVSKAMKRDFESLSTATAGGRVYEKYGLLGIRGEATSGFLSVKNIAMPIFLKALQKGYSENDAGAIALVHLMSEVEDTTIYHRGGKEGADFVKQSTMALLLKNEFPSMAQIEELDREFIARNLSAGGCADLLAITYFLSKI